MKYHPESWSVILPNPYDTKGQWELVENFDKERRVLQFMQEVFGADAQGRIGLISYIPGSGYIVDLPNPQKPREAWIFVEAFKRKRDAVRFVKKHYDGDAEGRIRPIDIMYGEGGPKDWSPTGFIPE